MSRKSKNIFLLIVVIFLCICFIYLGKKFTNQTPKQEESTTMISNTPKPAISSPSPSPSPTPMVFLTSIEDFDAGDIIADDQIDSNHLDSYFTVSVIDDSLKARIYNKSYRENDNITLDELCYLKILHYNFDHQIQVGECIVNKEISEDCMDIFTELFRNEYEIQSMYLIDEFWTGDGSSTDTASMNANNSSAFCYRTIAGTSKLSNHALGFAIDINPYQNPYITYRDGVPVYYHNDAENYADRTRAKPHMITHNDLCYQLFIQHGFTWGGDWKNSKDYQHFEKNE